VELKVANVSRNEARRRKKKKKKKKKIYIIKN
jgi:hypothetical protein